MEHEATLLFELILLLGLAAGALALFERLRLPAIAGFLLAGALAGPSGLGLVSDPERVRLLTEFGVVFLLFEIGIELPMERLQRLWRAALVAGGLQVGLTIAVVLAGALALGLPASTGWVLGAVIAMSSTALVMRILGDRGQVDSPQGQLAISILILQDLAIVPILLLVPLMAGGGGSLLELAWPVARLVVGLAAVFLVVRVVVPWLLERAARSGSGDLFSLVTLLVVLASAFFAEELGLTLAVGAFLAGAAASASPYSHQLFAEVVPLRGVLLGIFFTAVGMLFDPMALTTDLGPIAVYVAVTIGVKSAVIVGIHALVLRRGVRVGVLTGLALAQTGEFSFVLAEVARTGGLIDDSLHQVIVAGSILTLLATPFLIRASPRVADRLASRTPAAVDEEESAPAPGAHAGDRAVLIGFGHAGQTLARVLTSLSIEWVAVDANAVSVGEARERQLPVVFGDATRIPLLRRLGVREARLVAVAISDPLATRRIVSRVRTVAPDVQVLARTRYVQEVDPLSESGAGSVVAEEFEGSIEIVARALQIFDIPAHSIQTFTAALRDEGYDAIRTPAGLPLDPWLVELLDQANSEWIEVPMSFRGSESLRSLDLRARTGANVLALERAGQTTTNPAPDVVLQAGDRLLALGRPEELLEVQRVIQGNT